ncbi:MAG: holo-ACP synthase [Gammaproteobacteria bacterium]|nr:holo-ACP synthase [Gammaproteobacteria bacterium]
MSIYGIGTDIAHISRVQRSLDRHGQAFAERVLSDKEMPEYHASKQPARLVAKRFAVKEAVSKALGTGIGAELSFQDVSVGHDAQGKPLLEFSEAASARLAARGITGHHLSLSDDQDTVVAFVVLERG